MKNKILSIISVIAFLMGISACHSPEEFNPTVERNIINNLTASFPDDDSDDNSFTSEIDYTNHVITVVFPYNYPKLSDNVLQLSDLKKMRVIADLDNNVYVYPTLLFMDMTKDNFITVKDQTAQAPNIKLWQKFVKVMSAQLQNSILRVWDYQALSTKVPKLFL